MNRADFQALARHRLREARALRDRGLWSGCYYLSGIAVECAIKARIARATQRYDFPPNRKQVEKIYSHDLTELMKVAGLWTGLEHDMKSSPALDRNWTVVKDWHVDSRYNRLVTAQEALDLYGAVTQRNTGVLAWLRSRW